MLNGEFVARNVEAGDVDGLVFELEAKGFTIVDELWDDYSRVINLITEEGKQ